MWPLFGANEFPDSRKNKGQKRSAGHYSRLFEVNSCAKDQKNGQPANQMLRYRFSKDATSRVTKTPGQISQQQKPEIKPVDWFSFSL